MKKNLLLAILVLFVAVNYAQNPGATPTQPSFMVIPSDALLEKLSEKDNYEYIKQIDNQGVKVIIQDYQTLFIKHPEIKQAIAMIGELFEQEGFNETPLETALKRVQQKQTVDKAGFKGSDIEKSLLQEILQYAKADIYIELTYWFVPEIQLPDRQINFMLEAKDAYIGKRVGTASMGESEGTSEINIVKILKSSILDQIDFLKSAMNNKFADLRENGREIYINVQISEEAGFDMDEMFGEVYNTLADILTEWTRTNSVAGNVSPDGPYDYEFNFNDVRIPFYNSKNNLPMNAYDFIKGLRVFLIKNYGIIS